MPRWATHAAQAAYNEDESEENKAAFNEAASRLYEATGYDDQWMINNGLEPGGDFQYVAPGEGAVSGAPSPNARRVRLKEGRIGWVVPDPNAPSGWSEVQ